MFSVTRAASSAQSSGLHFVNGRPLNGPYPEGMEKALFALGCFWDAERLFWQLGTGIWVTAVGYSGGAVADPSYEEVCTGETGHAEAVLVVHDPKVISYEKLLEVFWASHDPTQGMRQGNDIGSQYRSAIFTFDDVQKQAAEQSRSLYESALRERDFSPITTEISPAGPFYFAEDYHQQYLAKNPNGYCGLKGTGVSCQL